MPPFRGFRYAGIPSRDEVVDVRSNTTTLLAPNNVSNVSNSVAYHCTLLPQAHAFSTAMSAVFGSIINGLSNGYFAVFFTAWLCWLEHCGFSS